MATPDLQQPPGPAAPRSRLRAVLAWMGADFGLAVIFFIGLAILIAAYGASFKWTEGPILFSVGIALGLVVIRFLYRAPSILFGRPGARLEYARSVRGILRDWAPIILIMWMFQSLETYTGVIRTTCIDDALYRMDLWLFGVEPTVWAGKLHHPLLTDWFSLAYGLYFFMPMLLATALSLRGRREDFREMGTALVIQMGIGFILFLFFPAGPPRYYAPFLNGEFQPPVLHSWTGLYELQQGVFDSADPARTRSAFPSLHCSLALLTLLYAWRFGDAVFKRHARLLFWIFLPLVVSLWVSTVYLRHHWVPDIAAGWVIGLSANLLAPWLRRTWPRPAAPP